MKNIFYKTCLYFALLLPSLSYSQEPLSKSEFRQLFTQGNLMILEKFYDSASKVFLKLNTSDPSNANINYKIGLCFLNIPGKKDKSIPYFENALKQTSGNYLEDEARERNAPEITHYYLGQAYQHAYRFEDAEVQFKKYRDLIGKWNLGLVREVDHWVNISRTARELVAKPVDCTITNLGDSVNGPLPDYSPVISADESVLSFTSRRQGTGGLLNKTLNDEFLEDIWICQRGPYGTWTAAKGISRTINSDNNEATIGLSADGQELYVYRDDGKGDGNIYISTLDGDYWNAPAKIDNGNINSKVWEPSACVSADGNTMYFVSDREGGFGGRDIYTSRRQPDRSWGKPENLGETINTPFDEDAPFMHPDGSTFFFSSSGHNTIGGFDVFYSTRVGNGVWAKPINMGYPINTTDDDIYFVTSSDGRRAYYASFRPEGKGEKDIYMVSLPNPIVQSVAILVGYLKNRDGSAIPRDSWVTTRSSKGNVVTKRANETSGKFVQSLFPGQTYEISIEVNGKKVFMDNFYLSEDSSYQNLGRGFFQRTIYLGDTTSVFSAVPAKKDTGIKFEKVNTEGRILLSENANDPAQNITIQMLNSSGNVIASVKTDKDGNFKFQNIPGDQKYILKIDENDPILKSKNQFYLADSQGKIIMPSVQEGKFFLFKNISPDLNKMRSVSESHPKVPVSVAMQGKLATDKSGTQPLPGAKVSLQDESGKVVQQKITGKDGSFKFEGLASDQLYTLAFDEKDPAKGKNDIYLVNPNAALVRKVAQTGDYFIFKSLPTDLNSLGTMVFTDPENLVNMRGKVISNKEAGTAIVNLPVKLVDNKGNVIQETRTDESGWFLFSKLSADGKYTVQMDDNDPSLNGIQKAFLSNEGNKTVMVADLGKDKGAFSGLPADLMKLGELKDASQVKNVPADKIIDKNLLNPDDANFDFVVYFPYNKKDIDISIASFIGLTDKVVNTMKDKGSVTIVIAASSSSVPTSSFTSNEALAESRANEVKDKIRAAVSLRNLDDSKLSYDITRKVQGPEYKNDAIANRKEYERWQFVKVIVR